MRNAVVVVIVEFSADLSPGWESALGAVNWFIYVAFTLNFLVQFALAPFKGQYLRRNWLAAISVLLPALRALRVLRAVRAAARSLRLVRVLTATNRGTRSLNYMLRGHQFGRVPGLTVAVIAMAPLRLPTSRREEASSGRGTARRCGGRPRSSQPSEATSSRAPWRGASSPRCSSCGGWACSAS